MTDLRYPIGEYKVQGRFTADLRLKWIDEIAGAPDQLRKALEGLSGEQLDTPYRPDGWTVRQVVHHLSDSHMNSYMRFKLALTEEEPSIKPYDERLWAELEDARKAPLEFSVDLLDSLHKRWVFMLQGLSPEDFEKRFYHPERDDKSTLEWNLGMYAWHGKHHVAHITSLRERKGW